MLFGCVHLIGAENDIFICFFLKVFYQKILNSNDDFGHVTRRKIKDLGVQIWTRKHQFRVM